jgi:hypothetical protein
MTQHSRKTSDFIEVKTNLQRYIYDPEFRFAPHKIAMAIRRARRPDLLLLHLRNSALISVSKSS